jgi:hypothetical protein
MISHYHKHANYIKNKENLISKMDFPKVVEAHTVENEGVKRFGKLYYVMNYQKANRNGAVPLMYNPIVDSNERQQTEI